MFLTGGGGAIFPALYFNSEEWSSRLWLKVGYFHHRNYAHTFAFLLFVSSCRVTCYTMWPCSLLLACMSFQRATWPSTEASVRRTAHVCASCDVTRLHIDLMLVQQHARVRSYLHMHFFLMIWVYIHFEVPAVSAPKPSEPGGAAVAWTDDAERLKSSLSFSLCFSLSLSSSLPPPPPPRSSPLSTRTKRSVMASSNHVTPTNCSWWPISAMDEDDKTTDGEESEEPTAEPKPFNKDRLVLYHWTQSFTSQKVRGEEGELCMTMEVDPRPVAWCSSLQLRVCTCYDPDMFSCACVFLHTPPEYERDHAAGQISRLGKALQHGGSSPPYSRISDRYYVY